MSHPQVTIDRLTPRRVGLEPHAMNCKSCRKRKIKCNRMRPSCDACKVFQCPCIYDATPKKRGPKTDVLEALLKRVDGLEKRLQDEKRAVSSTAEVSPVKKTENEPPAADSLNASKSTAGLSSTANPPAAARSPPSATLAQRRESNQGRYDGYRGFFTIPQQQQLSSLTVVLPDSVLDTFFTRIHGKPFYLLDEPTTRQKHQIGQLPPCLSMAIYAITVRYAGSAGTPEPSPRVGLEYALQARRVVDVDSPSIEGIQTLLLLSMTFFAHGLGRKAYMTLSHCIAMVLALGMYREASPNGNLSSSEREMRRRLFWTCYMMDRFTTCGSKRPCFIPDSSIVLRLPSSSPHVNGLHLEGEMFNTGPNVQYPSDSRRKGQGAVSLLIDITRILGITNKYLATGGVKGDSHFPWHSQSNLSKIRQQLDIWAAGTRDVFVSIDALFGHPECTTLLLSKLIYHLVHCLIYRPFLPVDLVELCGSGQHQSWQIEATNLCFSHSNAIVELVELGKNSPLVEWPAFVGYCVCTAGTVHVHGVHYKGREGEVFPSSADFLAKEMHQLSWLRSLWAGVQHQREMLQTVYACHSELVRTLSRNPMMRLSPVFHLEDFFDRYPGLTVDGSYMRLVDMVPAFNENMPLHPLNGYNLYANRSMAAHPQQSQPGLYQDHQLHQMPPSTPTSLQDPCNPSPTINVRPQQQPPMFPNSGADPAVSPSQDGTAVQTAAVGLSPPVFPSDATINLAPTPASNQQYAAFPFDSARQPHPNTSQSESGSVTVGTAALTPSVQSPTSGSHATTASDDGSSEKDSFLSLLEQLAENQQDSQDGPSELDFFLGGVAEGEGGTPVGRDEGDGGSTAAVAPSGESADAAQ
ncbi:hypothetical protein VTN02DRAFT_5400 [Thermoascus thermophilus]